jgi:hypothetical protein
MATNPVSLRRYNLSYSNLAGGALWNAVTKSYNVGFYFQDDVPVNDKLSVTYGARFDVPFFGNTGFVNKEVDGFSFVDEKGNLFLESDNTKRFFEASWVFKKDGKYYFTYSTGDTHLINYAIGNNPYGPFVYKGIVLNPVQGWTNHHSIVKIKHKWYLFYHDIQLSGKTHLRNVKMTELTFNQDGTIQTVNPIN